MSSPPPNPLTTTDFLKPQKPQNHSHPSIYQTFTPAFPLQHSNSRSHHQQPIMPNSGGFPPRAVNWQYGFLNSDVSGQLPHQLVVNPLSANLHQTVIGGSVAGNTKVVGKSSVVAKNGDDAFVTIKGRKVRVSEGTSLYAQCRSWLKNGLSYEKQPQYLDCVKSLPKPLPASMAQTMKEDDMEVEEETQDVDNLSAKELLQLHVNHAVKVRARLRNQRLQRIERYKDRLALLLPPVVDQQPKNDPAS